MTDAPKRLNVDLTSEDCDGIFMAAQPGQYLNIDEPYVHISDYKSLENRLRIARELADYWETKFHKAVAEIQQLKE